MDRVKLEARFRQDQSKHHVKALRREGFVPGSLYGKGIDPMSLEVNLHGLAQALKTDAGIHAIIDLKVDGAPKEASGPAMVKEIQKDYLGRHVTHVSIQKVSLKDKIHAPVTVVLHGEPAGVTRDRGILDQSLEEVEVKCLPNALPPHFDVDITSWEVGQTLHAADLPLPSGVELVTEPEAIVAAVRAPHIAAHIEGEEPAVEGEVAEAPAAEAEA